MADTFVKPPVYVNAKYLNDVNDATLGGAVNSLPSGVQNPSWQQTLPGDRICIDDATALALSDTAVGTLYGGIYMYVKASITTRAIVRGGIAFWKDADVGTAYTAYSDAQPTTALPTFVAGIWINVITTGQYGWIQIAGMASVLFDSTVIITTAGHQVTAKVSASVASTADSGTTVTETTVAAFLGVATTTVTTSTVSRVALTRGFGRI